MGKNKPYVKMARPGEAEAARTTIVGGQPPSSGRSVGDVPRGVEILIKKAAVDAEFRALLLARRGGAAAEIGLKLEAGEEAVLRATPASQLEAIIDRTKVDPRHRAALLSWSAAVIVAALGIAVAGCFPPVAGGSRPDYPTAPNAGTGEAEPDTTSPPTEERNEEATAEDEASDDTKADDYVTRGVRPDRP